MNLKITGLVKEYEIQRALDDFHLKIENISSLVIVGPSGGGKSTLLRLLAGLEVATSGDIHINDNHIINDEKWLKEYRKNVGVVFQAYNLFPHWTAMENITMPLIKVHGYSKEEASEKCLTLLRKFDLLEHVDKIPAKLSGGQQQRIAIARALAINSELLMFDEPTSALDPQLTSGVLDMILELKKEGTDILMVTHEMAFAKKAADHIVFIDEGKALENASADQFFNHPKNERIIEFLSHSNC
ncbi:MAG: amino acid ABC transporter ATP-binding protein [Clostridia bacterium]|nr:amino acid ABC transporter ATP-binding protein [Clostridia bacterium]